jgi:hypothetical protein
MFLLYLTRISIFLCYRTLQDSDDDNDDDDDMHFDFDDDEDIIPDQYFAMAAADALRRITQQRGEALCHKKLLSLSFYHF